MSTRTDLMALGTPAAVATKLDEDFVKTGETSSISSTLTVSGTLDVTGNLEISGTTVKATAAELDQRAITARIADVSTAGQVYVVVPYAGTVSAFYTALGTTIAGTNAVLTLKDAAGNTMGKVTIVTSGSGAGDVDSNTSLSNATVAAGDVIELETDGGSSGTAEVWATFLIRL